MRVFIHIFKSSISQISLSNNNHHPVYQKAFQGLVPYFYDHFHPKTAVELNVCRWNQVAADVIWRGPKGKDSIGKCRKYPRNDVEAICEDCRNTPLENTWTLHYTACKKPWACPTAREKKRERHRINSKDVNMDTCHKHHSEWFKLRKEFDELLSSSTGNTTLSSRNIGTYKKESFHGYCHGENDYVPTILPRDFDIRKVYGGVNALSEVRDEIKSL